MEWSTELDYWNAMPTNAQFGPTSMATNLIFKMLKGWQRIDELKHHLVYLANHDVRMRLPSDSFADLYSWLCQIMNGLSVLN